MEAGRGTALHATISRAGKTFGNIQVSQTILLLLCFSLGITFSHRLFATIGAPLAVMVNKASPRLNLPGNLHEETYPYLHY